MSNPIANQLFLAYLGRPADTAWRNATASLLNSNAPPAQLQNAFYSAAVIDGTFSLTDSTSQLVNKIFLNIFGFGASTFEQAAWAAQISNGAMTVQSAAWTIFSSYLGATNLGTAADIYQVPARSKLIAVEAYTAELANNPSANLALSSGAATATTAAKTFITGITSAATAAAATTPTAIANTVSTLTTTQTGTTYVLTTGVDSFVGASTNDVFNALIGDGATLSAIDTLNGGAGTDTLVITYAAASDATIANAYRGAVVSNIENLTIRNTQAAGAANLVTADAAGLSALAVTGSGNVTFNNVASGVTLSGVGSTGGAITAAYVAAATTASLAMSGGTLGAVTITGTGLTTTNISSSGGASTIGGVDVAGSKTLAITAAATLTTGDLTNVGASATLTVSGAAERVNVGTLAANVTTVTASGLTVGGLTATMSTTEGTVITGGAGNDIITTGVALVGGSVAAGAGTGDRLIVNDSNHLNTKELGAKYTGFEQLQVNNAVSVNLDHISGITAVRINDGGGATSVSNLSATQAGAVTIVALTGAATIAVKDATQVGTADILNITVSDGDSTTSEALAGTGDLTIAGVETINITATDDLTLATLANVTGMTSLTVSGPGDVSITTQAMAVQANASVNFSGLTANATFDFSGATGNAVAYTGTAVVDTVTEGAIGGSIIRLGAGNDVLNFTDNATAGATGDLVFGGTGADAMNLAAAVGNGTNDIITFRYVAGDSTSVAAATNSVNTSTVTDQVTSIANDANAAAAAGNVLRFDTEQTATTVQFSTTAVTLGTTATTAAFGFYVLDIHAATANTAIVYQDTDGDSLIEAGEFAVQLVGAAQFTTGEFAISTGDLLFTSAA
jgi:hypothetical protein